MLGVNKSFNSTERKKNLPYNIHLIVGIAKGVRFMCVKYIYCIFM